MSIMSDGGERTCPLCAEEMDLTDQQLKPCKCGYEICVWCWHHIMDMAEKDDTEGRCPACRAPYNKEKIVGMAANCERLVAEISMERKKSQKAKSKPSDGRKQLSSVRVIQRNLVYIVGLPLNLADEDLLQRKEYFGQYGKVLKVSMSRTAAGVIQQFPNNTCSVYITYSKEEEAIRCIQNVHGFVLEGRPLRACFGTTKYCHAWLRNVPCSNPDCLYLHEIGSQEDSFTKDEIISAYTRSRVQQITGSANNMERRSGNVLPAPLDDYTNNSSGKPIVKNVSSNSASILRGSPPNGSPGKSMALPAAAAWATRTTSCQPPPAGLLCSNGPSKPKPDTVSSGLAFSTAVAGSTQASPSHSDATKRPPSSDGSHNILPRFKNELSKPVIKQYSSMDNLANAGENPATSDGSPTSVDLDGELSSLHLSKESERGNCTTRNATNSTDITEQSRNPVSEKAIIATNEEVQNLSSGLASVSIDREVRNEQYGVTRPKSPPSDYYLVKSSQLQGLQQHNADKFRDSQITTSAGKVATSDSGAFFSREPCDWRLDSQAQVLSTMTEVEDDITSFDKQRLKDPEVVCRSPYLQNSSGFLHVSNNSNSRLMQQSQPFSLKASSLTADEKFGDDSLLNSSSLLYNGYPEKLVTSSSSGMNGFVEHSILLQDERNEQCVGRLVSEAVNAGSVAALDRGESSIISNILSMDFDAWDDSLTPQNMAKLLGDTDSQSGTLKKSSSWKVQNNNQSRFSFARHDESKFQTFDVHPSYGVDEQLPKSRSFIRGLAEKDLHMDKLGAVNGFHTSNLEETENLGSHSVSSNKLSAVSRAQISAPPGFSVPSRPPPPGFSSHERAEQPFDLMPGNSLLEPSPLLRNSHQTPPTGNFGTSGDIEFMDPAILAVGKGRLQRVLNSPGLDMRSSYFPQVNYLENDARLQLLMQRSQQQNLRFSEIGNTLGDTFSQIGDSYGISSRLDQQVSNLAPFAQLSLQQSRNPILSNGQWDGWNEMQSGNNLGVAEILRNERLGFNKFYTGYDDSKYRMPNSGDLYNRTFGM